VYEAQHVANPQESLLGAIQFHSDFSALLSTTLRCLASRAERRTANCFARGSTSFFCALTIRSRLPAHRVTVPNHVHLLRLRRAIARTRRFDLSFPACGFASSLLRHLKEPCSALAEFGAPTPIAVRRNGFPARSGGGFAKSGGNFALLSASSCSAKVIAQFVPVGALAHDFSKRQGR